MRTNIPGCGVWLFACEFSVLGWWRQHFSQGHMFALGCVESVCMVSETSPGPHSRLGPQKLAGEEGEVPGHMAPILGDPGAHLVLHCLACTLKRLLASGVSIGLSNR